MQDLAVVLYRCRSLDLMRVLYERFMIKLKLRCEHIVEWTEVHFVSAWTLCLSVRFICLLHMILHFVCWERSAAFCWSDHVSVLNSNANTEVLNRHVSCVRTVICKTIQHSVLIYWAVRVGRSRCLLAEILIVTVWRYPHSFVPFNCRVLMLRCVQTASPVIWLKRWNCKGTLVLQRACHTVVVSCQRLKPALLYLIIWESESSRNEFNFCLLLWVTDEARSCEVCLCHPWFCLGESVFCWQLLCLSDGWLCLETSVWGTDVCSHTFSWFHLQKRREKEAEPGQICDRIWLTIPSWTLQNSVLFGRSVKGRRRGFILAGLLTSPSRTCRAVLLKIDFLWVRAGFPSVRRKFQFCFLLNKYSQIRSNNFFFFMLHFSLGSAFSLVLWQHSACALV